MRERERWRDNIMYYCTYKFFGMNLASFGCALNIFFSSFSDSSIPPGPSQSHTVLPWVF